MLKKIEVMYENLYLLDTNVLNLLYGRTQEIKKGVGLFITNYIIIH